MEQQSDSACIYPPSIHGQQGNNSDMMCRLLVSVVVAAQQGTGGEREDSYR